MNTAKKGRKREWEVRTALECEGYWVVRAAGSKGPFDLIAFHGERIRGDVIPTVEIQPSKAKTKRTKKV